jgi:transcriptional regulator with XRE-family HTH domain
MGKVMRLLREKTGRNQSDVARAAGISTSMLSQIERGAVSPSVDTLVDVCGALGLAPAELFSRVSPRRPVKVVTEKNRLRTGQRGIRFEQLVTSSDLLHSAEMLLLEVESGRQAGLSGGGHEGIEMGHVLSGEGVLTVDGVEYVLKKGDSVSFSSRLSHKLVNSQQSTFRAIWTIMPPHRDYLETTGGTG